MKLKSLKKGDFALAWGLIAGSHENFAAFVCEKDVPLEVIEAYVSVALSRCKDDSDRFYRTHHIKGYEHGMPEERMALMLELVDAGYLRQVEVFTISTGEEREIGGIGIWEGMIT